MGVFLTVLKSIVAIPRFFGEEEQNQRSECRSAYGFDRQAVGSRLADDTEIESLVELLQFQQVGKHVRCIL
jgi:hypothetical protein